jgi:predicted TIM-barrel fold metal-dependent hydrolase
MIDSCIHFKKNNLKFISKISEKLSSSKINFALAMYDYEKSLKNRKIFYDNCKKFKNLIPVAFLRDVNNVKKEINNILKLKYKFVKIHPRMLKRNLNDEKFYTKVFKELNKTNLTILWCTFDGWENKASEINQLEFISKLINLTKKNKIILMHGGGPNIIKYYEKFRFIKRVYLDLSYTLHHYYESSVEKDIIFLMKRFDQRLLVGTDFPTISLEKHSKILNKIIKKSKLNNFKKKNILYKNLEKIINI